MSDLALSIILAHNEERRLPPTLEKIAAWLGAKGIAAESLVVDDGSGGGTVRVVAEDA